MHTSASDGTKSPSETIDAALALGITHLAITDHDTMDGYREARTYLDEHPGYARRLTLISGIEVSSQYAGMDVHILGYFIEGSAPELFSALEGARKRRADRALSIARALQADGYPITPEELLASGKTVNRAAIARSLVEAGAIATSGEAFATLIGRGCPYYIERSDLLPSEAIRLILRSGGVPVLAHPWLCKAMIRIEPLTEEGLMGVEAYHATNPPQVATVLEAYASSLGLLITGGSDWHGDTIHSAMLGSVDYPDRCLEKFLAVRP
ncbi:MAG: PHP domain-containing protein [Actinobacteria bacterium]|nr:PHP domain-containing protein [Actinomycetota bacterium]